MKKFRFPLKTVGVLRAHRERLAREALATAVSLRIEAEARHGEAVRTSEDLALSLAGARGVRMRPVDAGAALEAYRRERIREADLARQLALASAEAERRRQVCVEANRQVKIIDRLEATALAAHRAAGFKAEQIEFDEIAGSRAARNLQKP